MKPDESQFFKSLRRFDGEIPDVRANIKAQGLTSGKAHYFLDKWHEQGWYDYGSSVLDGWLTEAGEKKAAEV